MKKKNKKSVIEYEGSGSVFEDLGFSAIESERLALRSEILSEIRKAVKKHNLTQRQVEKLLDEPQPRVSDLIRGKLSKFSYEKLYTYALKLGIRRKTTYQHSSRLALQA